MEDGLKREYVIPLRRKTNMAPRWRRAKKSIVVLKEFLEKHMKCSDIVVCAELNELLWSRGAKNPPGKVKIVCMRKKIKDNFRVFVNLVEVGLDSVLSNYETKEVSKSDDKKDNVVDVKAEEKEIKEEKAEDKKQKEEEKGKEENKK